MKIGAPPALGDLSQWRFKPHSQLDAAGQCPLSSWSCLSFNEERKWFLAEGGFLSDCTKKTQLHFLVGKVSGRDSGSCRRRDDRLNLFLIGTCFGAWTGLSRAVICRAVSLLRGKDTANSEEFCAVWLEACNTSIISEPQQVPLRLDWAWAQCQAFDPDHTFLTLLFSNLISGLSLFRQSRSCGRIN